METDERALAVKDAAPMTAVEMKAQVQRIQEIMQAVMKEGEHFGTISGTPKPTLLKPGAEKLIVTFHLAPQYNELPGCREEDHFISYKFKCELQSIVTGYLIASGLGTCNSRERKYQKAEPWDIQNTLYKMACKRALVAAVLNATAASDIFTQDLEDMGGQHAHPSPAGQPITEKQNNRLWAIMNKYGKSQEQLKGYLKANGITQINKSNYEQVCTWAEKEEVIGPDLGDNEPEYYPADFERQPGEEG